MDLALLGPLSSGAQRILHHAIETKFVNSKREFKDEIFDGLYRLARESPGIEYSFGLYLRFGRKQPHGIFYGDRRIRCTSAMA